MASVRRKPIVRTYTLDAGAELQRATPCVHLVCSIAQIDTSNDVEWLYFVLSQTEHPSLGGAIAAAAEHENAQLFRLNARATAVIAHASAVADAYLARL